MNSWKITKFNPVTHEVVMTHESGHVHEMVIPDNHRSSPEIKNNYIKSIVTSVVLPSKVETMTTTKTIWQRIISIFKKVK